MRGRFLRCQGSRETRRGANENARPLDRAVPFDSRTRRVRDAQEGPRARFRRLPPNAARPTSNTRQGSHGIHSLLPASGLLSQGAGSLSGCRGGMSQFPFLPQPPAPLIVKHCRNAC